MNMLITGVGSGIGHAVAEYFAQHGDRVFGLDIKPVQIQGISSFTADICDESSLLRVFETLDKEGIRLELIINFAGIMFIGNYLETDSKRLEKIFNVNVLGTMRVNKAFFPLLSERGRILITTSEVAPLDALPFNGIYSVTKTALDAYAQALRHEAGLLGIRVITLRPGAVDTPLSNGSIPSMHEMVDNSKHFKGQAERFEALMQKFTGKMMQPQKFAERIYNITRKKHPRNVYTINANAYLRLLSLLPASMQVNIVKRLINKKEV